MWLDLSYEHRGHAELLATPEVRLVFGERTVEEGANHDWDLRANCLRKNVKRIGVGDAACELVDGVKRRRGNYDGVGRAGGEVPGGAGVSMFAADGLAGHGFELVGIDH